jgi:hypothetical protein
MHDVEKYLDCKVLRRTVCVRCVFASKFDVVNIYVVETHMFSVALNES